MATPDATSAPVTLWLTNRGRFKDATRCQFRRYLGQHFGPSGYGITTKAESLPLATGKSVHSGLEAFGRILLKEQRLPTLEEVRAIVAQETAAYVDLCVERGFQGILAGPRTDETILEQKTLIAGLLWALRLRFLPWLHEHYSVLEVEQERLHFLDCSCGAAPLDVEQHLARGCTGPALMIKCDLLAQHRQSGNLAYFECKTTGWESSAWAEQWETDFQLGLGTLDLQARYGREVTELFIVGLLKGSRKKDYEDRENPDAMRRQQSSLCYGYMRPGNPPLLPDDWLPSYEYVNDEGETKRKSKAHRRRGVWLLGESDWPLWLHHRANDPELDPVEAWARLLPASVLDKACFILGPMNRQDHQIKSVRASMLAEEIRWQGILWELYELQQAGHGWASDVFQARLDWLIPKSWNCRPFGAEAQCSFVRICHRQSGWQDPLGTGKYALRRPHHAPELQQAIARGLLVAEAQEEQEE